MGSTAQAGIEPRVESKRQGVEEGKRERERGREEGLRAREERRRARGERQSKREREGGRERERGGGREGGRALEADAFTTRPTKRSDWAKRVLLLTCTVHLKEASACTCVRAATLRQKLQIKLCFASDH